MNHPEKVMVAGSGMKNRYKTIIPSQWEVLYYYSQSMIFFPNKEKMRFCLSLKRVFIYTLIQ